jgi:hypothetical protein
MSFHIIETLSYRYTCDECGYRSCDREVRSVVDGDDGDIRDYLSQEDRIAEELTAAVLESGWKLDSEYGDLCHDCAKGVPE